jgi:site-specific recombinase XerD
MMLLFYATGLRLSEARLLKWEHIHYDENLIFVKKGKGAKDRIAVLPSDLAEQLKAYRQTLRPQQVFVFEGKTMGKAIAPKTVQWAFKRARQKAKLPQWVTAHVLRHSYATASLKNGTDLLSLQLLLGHKKIATTTRYLHLNVSHFKKSYNPLSESCLSQYLETPLLSAPVPPPPSPNLLPSDKSSDNLEKSISKNTNPTIGKERC